MKKFMIFIIALIPFVLIMTLQLTTTLIEETKYVAVEELLFEDKELVIEKLTYDDVVISYPAKINPTGATYKDIIYTSSDETIAIVDKDGNITFKDFGYVVIKAQSVDNNAVIAECRFHVTDTKAHRISINNKIDTIIKDEIHYITHTIIPVEALDKNVTYSSSNTNVAVVMPDGKIIAVDGGVTTITITTGNGITDSFDLEVLVPVKEISIERESLVTGVAQAKFPDVEILPSNATDKTIHYYSENNDIATIDNAGNILFNTAGKCKFIAKSQDGGYEVYYTVEYTGGYILSATINSDSLYIEESYIENKELFINTTIYPLNANTNNVYYESQNQNIVQVVDKKKLYVVGGGRTTIDVYIKTSSTTIMKIGEVEIFIRRNAEQINVAPSDIIEVTTKEYQLEYNVTPIDHTDVVNITATSTVANITNAGYITFDSPGEINVCIKAGSVQKNVVVKYIPAGAKVVNINSYDLQSQLNYLDNSFVLVFDDDLEMTNVTYSISDDSIIEYDANNQSFNICKGGDCIITATSSNGNVASINVSILRKANQLDVSVLGFGDNANIITAKKELSLSTNVLPLDTTDKSVSYSISDTSIANMKDNKIIFATAGQIELQIVSNSNELLTKTIKIKSTYEKPTGFSINNQKIVLEDLGESWTLLEDIFISFAPSDYVYKMADFELKSQDGTIVDISQNVVTAIAKGESNIVINIKDSSFAQFIPIEVQVKSTDVDFVYNDTVIDGGKIIGESILLSSKIYPTNANNQKVIYSVLAGDATINANGLLTFTKASGVANVRITTVDSGVFKDITIERIGGPQSLNIYRGEVLVSGEIIKHLPGDNANIILNIEMIQDGLLDPENINYNDIAVRINDEDGLLTSVTLIEKGYYSVAYSSTKAKSLKTMITFSYGTTYNNVTIKFYKLSSLNIQLDPVLYNNSPDTLLLNNADDLNCGLERKRVWGVYSYYNDNKTNTLPLIAAKNVEAIDDTIYWWSDNSSAYFVTGEDGLLYFNVAGITNETLIQITIGNESNKEDSTITATYQFTVIPNACNIFSAAGYKYAIKNQTIIALHVNLGSKKDESETTGPFDKFNPTDITTANFPIHSEIFGNGYFINYQGYDTAYEGQIVFYADVRNLVTKMHDFSENKSVYKNHGGMMSATISYCVIQNAKRGMYVAIQGDDKNVYINNSIIKHVLDYGILVSDYDDLTLYLENMLIYDCSTCCVYFQKGTIKIKGFFDTVNFRVPSEFDVLGVPTVLESAYKSSTFDGFVDRSSGNKKTYKANVSIVAVNKNVLGTPLVSDIYFWNGSGYVANSDNCTGNNYTKITYTVRLLGTTVHFWLAPLTNIPSTSTPNEARVYRQI